MTNTGMVYICDVMITVADIDFAAPPTLGSSTEE